MIHQTKEGWWVIAGDSHIGKWVSDEGKLAHNHSLLDRIMPFVPIGGTVVDAGAYIGDMTCAFIEHVGPNGAVFAFEPQPLAFQCLQLNCPSARCMNAALSDRAQTGTLAPDSLTNYGACRVDPGVGEVKMLALDSLFLQECHLLKADTEGAEYNLLIGASETIRKLRPVLVLEVNESALLKFGHTSADLLDLIRGLGYNQIMNVYDNHEMTGPQFDIICR